MFLKHRMSLLFEYGEWVRVSGSSELRFLLREIWNDRQFVDAEQELTEDQLDSRYQPFLKFDGDLIRANNFVGFIQNDDAVIEIYPKVFRNISEAQDQKELMLRHIFFWFSYCRKWQFPFTRAGLDTKDIDSFPELIINLIARQFLETVSNQPLALYQPVEEALRTPRGSINFKRYLNNGFSSGNLHIVDCDYEPFVLNNRVNRIIKYCSRLLVNQTKFAENLRMLQETIFVLDEVGDEICSIHDVDSVSINSFFSEYASLMEICRSILANQLYSTQLYDLSQWCLLFPMEYIFEDFLAGFLESNLSSSWKLEYQKSNQYLSDVPKAFQMRHDIFLTARDGSNRKVIVDTKYKLRPERFKDDPKRGVDQSDLYQMVAYAVKRGCTDVVLVYPNITESTNEADVFEIVSGFEGRERIRVIATEIPFWSIENFAELSMSLRTAIDRLFRANLTGIEIKGRE